MPRYYRAPRLDVLVAQVNALFPKRDKQSDGWIGDPAHQSRKSDHNAWVKDALGQGVVTGQDIDADLSQNIKVNILAAKLFEEADPSIKYLISNGRITDRGKDGRINRWLKYTGTNSHTHHLHISIKPEAVYWNSKAPWVLGNLETATIAQHELSKERVLVYKQPLMNGSDVKEAQERLIILKFLAPGSADGVFGRKSQDAVIGFQRHNGLTPDGKVGPNTWAKLRS